METKIISLINKILEEENLSQENKIAIEQLKQDLNKSKITGKAKSTLNRFILFQFYDYIKDHLEDLFE